MNEEIDKLQLLLAKYGIKDPPCASGIGDGWLPLVEDLIQKLVASGWDRDLHQIKEKWGGLRFYVGAVTDEQQALIAEAERASRSVCERCSAPGSASGKGWIVTLCGACREAAWSTGPK